MRIAYVSAGAGGMLCGSCLHDNTLAAALRRGGHDVALIPTYTPIRTDEESVSLDHVFYGAVSLYLRERVALFRHAPRFVERLLDRPALLEWVSRRFASTSPSDLGSLTISVLEGENGRQKEELHRLVEWLRADFRPQVVHLTNSLFLGLAAPIRRELGVPVICSVQGEDLFLDQLPDSSRRLVLDLLRAKARDADLFIATSEDYANRMREMLAVAPARMRVVPLGVSLAGFEPRAARPDAGRFNIGYLARISPDKGLHRLAEGFRILAAGGTGREKIRLRAAGYLGRADRPYLEKVKRSLEEWGLSDRFEYVGEVSRAEKIAFLDTIDVLSVPTVYREAKGLFVLEAMAAGVPVVQPRHGSFPEVLGRAGGGVLFEPDSAEELALALEAMWLDPTRRAELGAAGAKGVREHYSDETMARETLKVYLAATEGECAT